MTTKANKFIGILINDAACRLNGVPTEVIGAIGEVLRDFLHINLENITITVMEEDELMKVLSKEALTSAEDSNFCEGNLLEKLVGDINYIYEFLKNRITISESVPSASKIVIYKSYLKAVASGSDAALCAIVLPVTHAISVIAKTKRWNKFKTTLTKTTDVQFATALIQLAKEL